MEETRHTPGPWSATRKNRIATANGAIVAQVYTTPHKMTQEGKALSTVASAANSRVIAAAPDMLGLLLWLDRKGGLGLDVHERITAVIGKAVLPTPTNTTT